MGDELPGTTGLTKVELPNGQGTVEYQVEWDALAFQSVTAQEDQGGTSLSNVPANAVRLVANAISLLASNARNWQAVATARNWEFRRSGRYLSVLVKIHAHSGQGLISYADRDIQGLLALQVDQINEYVERSLHHDTGDTSGLLALRNSVVQTFLIPPQR